jgi:hypothetical protein
LGISNIFAGADQIFFTRFIPSCLLWISIIIKLNWLSRATKLKKQVFKQVTLLKA